ncbi:hypothetical protein GCM10010149_87920 [Nonomuraea roseoviolacea subsp. roseoviolacea]|uniref:hypothetical protein n=1 Tax=Nonomuraea roseoviolacea TaxID=103837 RepID=UPI0031D5B37A
MIVYQIGPFFAHGIRLAPGSPFVHTSVTTEAKEPFRYGRSLIVQYWPGRAVVLGRWEGRFDDEETALLAGVHGRPDEVLDEEGRLQERFKRQKVRQRVAAGAHDLDDEWQLVNALDLMDDGGSL